MTSSKNHGNNNATNDPNNYVSGIIKGRRPKMEILLVKEKETAGTWRFKENKEDHPITIYLTKEQVKELGNPHSIKITITAA
jgi:hypothetical protein